MKKGMALLAALLLMLTLWAGDPALAETAPGRNAELDAAFAAGEPVRLVPVEPDGRPGAGWAPISLSPDGRTVLWRNKNERTLTGEGTELRTALILTRDGTEIPVTFNANKGAGDPYEKSKMLVRAFTTLPSMEGLSWSDDGRWIALSDQDMINGASRNRPFDAPVLDTSTGEFWLTERFGPDLRSDDFGYVFLNRVDRSGTYLYYLARMMEKTETDSQSHLCLCRRPVEGGDREILCDALYEDSDYDLTASSNLIEMADGSWLLTGIKGTARTAKGAQLALIRFSPSGDGWSPEIRPLGIPYGCFDYDYASVSTASGYSLLCLQSPVTAAKSIPNATEDAAKLWRQMFLYVNLLRIRPGDETGYDLWCLKKTGDGTGNVEMVPAEDFLWSIKIATGRVEEDERQAAEEWYTANGQGQGNAVPASYDEAALEQDSSGEGRLLTICAAVSPDGYYALINAGTAKQYALYLVSLETMEVRPVEAPEGVAGVHLGSNSFGMGFRPGIVWNQDGTLLIGLGGKSGQTAAFRLETGGAGESID